MYRTVRISEILHQIKCPVAIEPDNEYSLLTVKLHHKGVVLRETKKGSLVGSKMYRVSEGQLILSGIDARNGAFGIIPKELDGAIVTNDFWVFDFDEKIIKREFFYWLTNTPLFLNVCIKASRGETQRIRLQKSLLLDHELRIPPIEHQERFLERIKSVYSLLEKLNNELDTQYSHIVSLHKTILQEAMEGKLTVKWREQHPELINGDDHASKLLEKIKSEKERSIIEGQIKKEKPLAAISDDEKPFELPEGWVWCRLGDICGIKRGVNPRYCEMSDYSILNQKCVRWNQIERQWAKPVIPKWFQGIDKNSLTHLNDVLVNSTGEGTIGRAGLVRSSEIGLPFDTHVLRVSTCDGVISSFLMYFINSFQGQNQISQSKGAKTTKQTELGVNNLRSLLIPLPPSTEQEAIVGKTEELLVNIEKLEKQISERKDLSEMLMQSVLREAFSTS